jgi:hypothetical protein
MQAGLFFFPFRFRAEVWVHLEDQMFIMEGGSARIASLLFVFKAVRLNGKLFAPINILRVTVHMHPEMN